jgi:CRP-like cAMP-binding protein
VVVIDGRLSASLRLPGSRELVVATVGRGELLGELALLDGGVRSATVRALEQATVLRLSGPDFVSLVSRIHPASGTIRRRIAAIACRRLRSQIGALAASLDGDESATAGATVWGAAVDAVQPPRPYLARLPFFRDCPADALGEILRAGRFVLWPARRALIAEGARSEGCLVMVNGAVEEVLVRGSRRIRVELAGPGRALGYAGLIDGEGSSVTAVTRERTLALAIPRAAFAALLEGETAGSHAFLAAIERDLTAALRASHRPHARLASAR